jgi:hypothetical protein
MYYVQKKNNPGTSSEQASQPRGWISGLGFSAMGEGNAVDCVAYWTKKLDQTRTLLAGVETKSILKPQLKNSCHHHHWSLSWRAGEA